ncbi:MAG TPA: serine protease [Labilithrix sp.]|jgi:serine protease Do
MTAVRALACVLAVAGCAPATGPGASHRFGSSSVSPAELRKNTVSIYVETPDRIATLFEGIATRMQARGKRELAQFFASQTGGAFGSGFLVRKNGEMLVVTNRHVVDFADEAVLAVEGSDKTYPVEVVYADRVYDLAILAFREKPPPGIPGLELSSDGVHDLETVVATGFPGLDGHPSYQATRGQVSNERFAASSHGKTITLIQHTAPIDPGSSGGPLTSEAGAVVGVNFIKFTGRDNAYLAIPAVAVAGVLDSAAESKKGRRSVPWLTQRLAESCGRLIGGLRKTDEPSVDVYDLITNDVIAERGMESLDAMAKTEKDAWNLFLENPTVAMRVAVAVRLWKESHGKEGLPVSCLALEQDPEAEAVRLQVKFERGNRDTFWRFEQGQWKLAAFDKMVGAPSGSKPKPKPKR